MSLDSRVDRLAARGSEANENATAVGRIRPALDQTGFGQAIEALRNAARGEHRGGHQVGWVQLVRGARSAECCKQVEPAGLKAMRREAVGELGFGEGGYAEQPAEDTEGGDVDVGALAAPLGDDSVDVIGGFLAHLRQYTSTQETY